MITNFKIFEKTSLIGINVPFDVMKDIQRNYMISGDARWKELKYKKDINLSLRKNYNKLIISICENKIFIIYSFDKEYFIETYKLNGDDFGFEEWQRVNRLQTTITDIIKIVDKGCKIYELIDGNWSPEFSSYRRLKKEKNKFEDITNNFKIDFAKNFTNIVKRLYGKKSDMVSNTIIDYLKDVNKDESEQTLREILFLNVANAKKVDYYRKKANEKDPYNLYDKNIQAHSLTIFNEYLAKFENDYSEKYKEYLNIPIMIERYTRDKIMTAFMVYLYSGKLIEL